MHTRPRVPCVVARRALTNNDFRRLALSMSEATEGAHMGHADFRVAGKIFATIPDAAKPKAMVKLTPEQQARFMQYEPDAFEPGKGAWGKRGCTYVHLGAVSRAALKRAIFAAWCGTAPKRLVQELGPPNEP